MTYYKMAGLFLLGAPAAAQPQALELHARETACFERALDLLPWHWERATIPYHHGRRNDAGAAAATAALAVSRERGTETAALTGYLISPKLAGGDRNADGASWPAAGPAERVVVVNGGYDSTAEESYLMTGAAALRRGYSCLLFDGPGQGSALLRDGLVSRADWEHVVTPVVDWLVERVPRARVALVGISFGGYLAARAAASEARLSACVLDPAQVDVGRAARARLPLPQSLHATVLDASAPPSLATRLVSAVLSYVAAKPTAGWSLRRGMHVHGASSPLDYMRALQAYTCADRVNAIRCPVLVCDAEHDPIAAQARELFDLLTCPQKAYIRFTDDEGAGQHCEAGNRALLNHRVFDWLDTILGAAST